MALPWSGDSSGGQKIEVKFRPSLKLRDLSNGGDFGQSNLGNRLRGVKNGGIEVWGGLGWPENTQTKEREKLRPAGFAGPIWAHLASGG